MRADPVRPRLRSVSHGYLTAMGVRLIAGRELERRRHGRRADGDPRQPRGGAAVLRPAAMPSARRWTGTRTPARDQPSRRRSSASSTTSATRRRIANRFRRCTPTTGSCSRSNSNGATRRRSRTRSRSDFCRSRFGPTGDPAAAIPALGARGARRRSERRHRVDAADGPAGRRAAWRGSVSTR